MTTPNASASKQSLWSVHLITMYADTLLMAIGFFMLGPLLGVHMINNLGWSAAVAGSVMAISGLSQHGFKFIAGAFADRIGYKKAILLGVGVRIVGYTLYGLVDTPGGFMLAAFIAGLGGSIFHPASYATYARLVKGEDKSRIFAMREMLSNIGFILGPVIGMFLLKLDFTYVCFSAAAMFAIAFVVTLVLLPSLGGDQSDTAFLTLFSDALRDRAFVLFSVLALGLWALMTQLYLAVPVRADFILPDSSVVAYMYMGGAICMVLLQLPVLRFVEQKLSASQGLALGSIILGTALLLLGFSQGVWTMLLAILLFTFGQMIALPLMNNMISRFSGPSRFATYFGLNGFALAIGGFLGNSGSGKLYDIARSYAELQWVPWTVLFSFGALLTVLFMTIGKRFDQLPYKE
ncbi:MFS transporter [Paenibacillus sp. YYML68]|uniref:MFS transporter n=1 Tax=Paenibacillus sp. YYML68 TaxID=2909250 RepID=UPI00248F5949|nr:MFS transporter [Paenibacillus sp. YYML68]